MSCADWIARSQGQLNTDRELFYIGDEVVAGAVQVAGANAVKAAAQEAAEAAAGDDEALTLFIRANALTEAGDVQGAIPLFKQAEKIDPVRFLSCVSCLYLVSHEDGEEEEEEGVGE